MGLKDLTPGHFTLLSKAKPKTMLQFPNRPPPSNTLKLYIYSTGLQYSMVYFFLLCLLQSRKGQKFEDQYYNDISDKIWLVLPFPSSFLSWTGFKHKHLIKNTSTPLKHTLEHINHKLEHIQQNPLILFTQ